MVNRKRILSLAGCTLLVLGGIADAQTQTAATGNQVTVPFSDPSRPGTVKVNVLTGSITVRVGTGRDVIVNTVDDGRDRDDDKERERERARSRERSRQGSSSAPADDPTAGLRRLTQPSGVNIVEENNLVSITAPAMLGGVNVSIQVPAATSLVLRAVNGGEVSVTGVTGSIEVNNVNGRIRLTDVGGPVIAHATNGDVFATLRQLPAGKPMAFTSFNGDVDVTLPAAAKATLKMRSDRGDVYTDFDVQMTQAPPRSGSSPGDARRDDPRGRDRDDSKEKAKYRLEMDRSIYGTVNGGGPDFELRTFNGEIYLRKAK
jgi:hypothetical protein